MRKDRAVELKFDENKTIKCKIFEIRVKDLIDYYERYSAEAQAGNEIPVQQVVEDLLPFCTTLKKEELWELAPSDWEELFSVFKELNSPFLSMARTMGLEKVVKRMGEAARNSFVETLEAFRAKSSPLSKMGTDTAK